MYKLLLSWRYLRTRHIALASIISVTLGVATLIVVNSVMAGFTEEMHKRLHSILSDLVFESVSLDGFADPEWHKEEIRKTLGDDIEGITAIVHVPAMLSYSVRGQFINKQINVIGIDDESYAQVSDIGRYLLHPENQTKLSWILKPGGFAPDRDFPTAGWAHRRQRVAYERELLEHRKRMEAEQIRRVESEAKQNGEVTTGPAPESNSTPIIGPQPAPTTTEVASDDQPPPAPYDDTGARDRTGQGPTFDAMEQQHTGIILGIATCSVRHRDDDGKVQDYYLCRPGDDVQISFPTSGAPPKIVSENFTVVDLYESKMSEYDQTFAFAPLRRVQELRGMIDPARQLPSVTSIQIRLRPGVKLNEARDKLRARFPAEQYPYRIQTWMDMQGPLLSAVQLESTILNILLFLIIAVAGFGILATFFMIVVEKTRDIGILKALGTPSRGVMSIFLSYGLSLGIVGSGVGAIIGYLFVLKINGIAKIVEWVTGREVFDSTVYYFHEIPTIISPFTIAWVSVGAILIAVLASILPAVRAARMHPVEALRYE